MTFTGTLIEDLMTTVERAEQKAHAEGTFVVGASTAESPAIEPFLVEPLLVEPLLVEPWFASGQENTEYDSKFIGVA